MRKLPGELRMRRRRFIVQWIAWVTLAETAAFALAAFAGIIATFTVPDRAVAYGIIVSAGAVGGTLIGLGQWTAFHRSEAQIPPGPWVGGTALGAALAWSIALLPSLAEFDWSDTQSVFLLIAVGVALLLSIPLMQFFVLRRYRRGAGSWVLINLVAWGIGMLCVLGPLPFINFATPIEVLVVVFALAGLATALTVSIISGLWARPLIVQQPHFDAERPPARGEL